jgi:hypothetical protein
MMESARLSGAIVLVGVLSASAVAQTAKPDPTPPRDVEALAERMPDCKEFRNECQVCARQADGKLGCSNIGVACNPSGEWQCSISKADEPKK